MNQINYSFTAIPTNLFCCCDNNCRSMLFTLIQVSSFYSKENGWFYRTNEDLQQESNLSKNLVIATLDSLVRNGIIEIECVGKRKGKEPNKIKVNFEKFKIWEFYTLEECCKNPKLSIVTSNYKEKGWIPCYLNSSVSTDSQDSCEKDKQTHKNILLYKHSYIKKEVSIEISEIVESEE